MLAHWYRQFSHQSRGRKAPLARRRARQLWPEVLEDRTLLSSLPAVGFDVAPLVTGTVTAGAPVSFSVTAVDASGNPVPDYLGPVSLGSSDPGMTAPALSYTFTAADAGTHVFTDGMILTHAGTDTITASAPGLATGVATVTVVSAAPYRVTLSAAPGWTAGIAEPLTINVWDVFGNPATSYAGTIRLTDGISHGLIEDVSMTTADAGVGHTSLLDDTAGPINIVVSDANNGLIGSINGFTIAPAAPVRLGMYSVFDQPTLTQGTAGALQSFTVTAYDAFGNVATTDATTLGVTVTDPNATVPTTVTMPGGIAQFFIFWETSGNQLITVTDLNDPSMNLAASWQVAPGLVTSLQISGPATATAGIPASFTVRGFDAFHNPSSDLPVAPNLALLHFDSTDPQAILPADTRFTSNQDGVQTFSIVMGTAGPQGISVGFAQGSTLVSAVTGVQVIPGAIGRFAVTPVVSATAGVAQSFTVSAQDAFGNALTNYTGTVTFSSSDVQAGLPADYTFTAADHGVHTFTAVLKTAGPQTVSVHDTTVPTAVGTTGVISVVAAGAAYFTIAAPATAIAGQSFTVTVTAFDAFGNVATGYRGKVHFSDTAGNSGLPSDYSFSASDSGVHVFTITLTTVGTQTLTLTDVTNALVEGSAGLSVSPKPSGGGGGGSGGGGKG